MDSEASRLLASDPQYNFICGMLADAGRVLTTAQLPTQIDGLFGESVKRLQERLQALDSRVKDATKHFREKSEHPQLRESVLFKAVHKELLRHGDKAEFPLDRFIRMNALAKPSKAFPSADYLRKRAEEITGVLLLQVRRLGYKAGDDIVADFISKSKVAIQTFFSPRLWLQFLPDPAITVDDIYLAQEFPAAMANHLISVWSPILREKVRACLDFVELPALPHADLLCEFEGEQLRGALLHVLFCTLLSERKLRM